MINEDVSALLAIFPRVEFAFTYGSGAVQQGGYNYKKHAAELPMLDLILVVEDSLSWHTENMRMNPSHYSSLLPMNPSFVTSFQEFLPAHFWFNAYVSIPTGPQAGRLMKYGVISKTHALKDLNQWNDLYIAGRLHKPVQILQTNEILETAMEQNREQALRAALFLLPEKFTEIELFTTVASLSYVGDPRMLVGENPKKVRNLVSPIISQYRSLYNPSFDLVGKDAKVLRVNGLNYTFRQEVDQKTRWKMCVNMPGTLRRMLSISSRQKYLRCKPPVASTVRAALAAIVARSASMQTIKGLFTVGLLKSSSYIAAKVAKRFMLPI
eukprot:gene9310-10276_t